VLRDIAKTTTTTTTMSATCVVDQRTRLQTEQTDTTRPVIIYFRLHNSEADSRPIAATRNNVFFSGDDSGMAPTRSLFSV